MKKGAVLHLVPWGWETKEFHHFWFFKLKDQRDSIQHPPPPLPAS